MERELTSKQFILYFIRKRVKKKRIISKNDERIALDIIENSSDQTRFREDHKLTSIIIIPMNGGIEEIHRIHLRSFLTREYNNGRSLDHDKNFQKTYPPLYQIASSFTHSIP